MVVPWGWPGWERGEQDCPVWNGGPISQIPPLQLSREQLYCHPPALYAVLGKTWFGAKSLMLNKSLEIKVMANVFECCLCVSSFIAYKVLRTVRGLQ